LFCFLAVLVTGWQTCFAANNQQKRVLMLSILMREAPTTMTFENVYLQVVNRELGGVDLYTEFIDVVRFQESGYREALGDFLARKYRNQKLDLVVVDSGVGLDFVKKYEAQLFPGTPVVFLTISKPETFPNSTGAFHLLDFKSSFDLALKLQPGTREVFVVVGSGEFDNFYATRARPQFEMFESRVKITYLEGMTMADLKTKLANLPADSIIYYLVFSADTTGNRYTASDALRLLSPFANVPLYTWYEWPNDQIVGGTLLSGRMLAEKLAEISVRVLKGEKPENIPVVEIQPRITTVDWRQLRRWQINEALVPPGTTVRFKEPTFWEAYKWRIVAAISLCVFEAILIALLLMSWMRKRQAELRSRRFAALAETEHRHLDEVISNVPGIVWESRLDASSGSRRADFVSDYVEKVLGYSADEFKSTPDLWLSVILEDDRQRAAQCSKVVFATGQPRSIQFRCRKKNGHLVWVEEHLEVITDQEGRAVGLRGVALNINERKKAEAFRDGQRQILERIAAQAPLHDVLNSLVLLVEAQSEETLCSISLLDGDGRHVSHTVAPSLSLEYLSAIDGSLIGPELGSCSAMYWRKRVFTNNLLEDPLWSADRDLAALHGLHECLATPILSHADDVLGSLTIYYKDSRNDESFEQQLIETVTHIARIAIERHRAEEAMRSLGGRLINAQEEERRRIARELHDDLNQSVALLAIQLERCRLDPPESTQVMGQGLEELWKNARDLSGSIRALSHRLHPSILDSLGLAAATDTFCQELSRAHDVEIEFVDHDIPPTLNNEIALCVYRVIQEALHNVVKHSRAKHARVDLSSDAQAISLTIVDSGTGFEISSNHNKDGLGLISMRERLRLLKGELSIQSQPSKGTVIKAYVPLNQLSESVADFALGQPILLEQMEGL
jgi:PAS domain S-box-containing protein